MRNVHFRTFEKYSEVFGYSRESLNGKSILDVGSGDSDFAIKAAAVGAKVARLDPKYRPKPSPEEIVEKPYLDDPYLGPPSNTENAVAGIVQQLSYNDDCFDETIANTSMYWVERGITKSLAEMLRLTRPGGFVKIFPAFNTNNGADVENIDGLPLGAKLIQPEGVHRKTLVIPKTETIDLSAQEAELTKVTEMIRFTDMLPPLPVLQ